MPHYFKTNLNLNSIYLLVDVAQIIIKKISLFIICWPNK